MRVLITTLVVLVLLAALFYGIYAWSDFFSSTKKEVVPSAEEDKDQSAGPGRDSENQP